MCGDVGMRVLSGPCYDKSEEEDPVLLVGKGYVPTEEQLTQISNAVGIQARILDMEAMWTHDVINGALRASTSRRTRNINRDILVFNRLHVNGNMFITELYRRASRTNYFIQVKYNGCYFVARLHFVVRIPYTEQFVAPSTGPRDALRIAIVTFYKRLDRRGQELTSRDFKQPNIQTIHLSKSIPGESYYPLDPESITSKMCVTRPVNGLLHCLPYSTLSVRH